MASISGTAKTDAECFDRLIKFSDARRVVGISRSKIYLLLNDGAFPQPVKVGRTNYFSSIELQQWIEAQLQSRNGGLVP